MQNLLSDLTTLLSKDERLISENKLLKNKVIELALSLDAKLIKLLLGNKRIKEHFFDDIEGVLVFDKIKFQRFVSNKQFLPDSYTAFKNKIGLVNENGDYLSESKEIVLAWPYKDCILEGGQIKEDQKRDEVFWNETLAPDEIDRLLAPKVLTNFKRCDKDDEKSLDNKIDFTKENLIIKGNNLLALYSLKKKFAGKVKLIYIDPPYNPETNSNTFCYNNNFNESTWLTFMRNRLEVAKTLLKADGTIIVAIDENEFLELGILLKEIFKNHETHCVTIVHNPRGIQGTNFSYTHEYAFFVIPKDIKAIGNRKIETENIDWRNLRDNGGESLRTDARNCFYPIILENDVVVGFGEVLPQEEHPKSQTVKIGNRYYIYPVDKEGIERKWRYAKQSVEEIKHLLRGKKTKNGYEIEIGKDFGTYRTVWVDPRYDANEYGTKLVKSLVPDCKFDFPKSLYNVYDCIYAVVANDKDAIVLDFFAGSGTTAHAVLELNKEDGGHRRFILCEQMHYIDTVTKERVHKVIKNNKNGSFVFTELLELNEKHVRPIEGASTKDHLMRVWDSIKNGAFLSYKVKPQYIDDSISDFEKLSLENQKKFLLEVLDKNQLYVNYSEIDDKDYKISDVDKKLNNLFYEGL